MRILPSPWEGIHPAFPVHPEPFNESRFGNAVSFSGCFGGLVGTVSALFGRSAQVGLKAAAYATPLFIAVNWGLTEVAGSRVTVPYFESKGLHIPRRKLIERPLEIDADNFIVAGALGALVGSRLLPVSWSVTGWRRAVGLMALGGFGGDAFNYAYHWKQVAPVMAQIKAQRALRDSYKADIKFFLAERERQANQMGHLQTDVGDPHPPAQTPGMTSLQDLMDNIQKGVERGTAASADPIEPNEEEQEEEEVEEEENVDEKDPKPHRSQMRDGERVFRPETNYRWQAGPDAEAELQLHIAGLQQRRARMAHEAALIYHELAIREATYYKTPASSITKKERRRKELVILNHLHINAYLEISQIDWCIADSRKNILQLHAMSKENELWTPPEPPLSDTPPRYAMTLLDELQRDNQNGLAEVEELYNIAQIALQQPDLKIMEDDGKPKKDPYGAVRKAMRELEESRERTRGHDEAIDALRKHFLGREDGAVEVKDRERDRDIKSRDDDDDDDEEE